MKQVFVLILCAFLMFAAFSCAEETVFEFSTSDSADADVSWTYPVSREILEDPQGVLILVNKDNLLDKTYPSEDMLVEITLRKTSSSKMQGREIAVEALGRMFEGAEAAGYKLYVESAYRTYRTQEVMHYNRVESMGYDDGLVQTAGASEHQTGMAFDVVNKEWGDRKLNNGFAKTEEAQWMLANCADYGFILRYPEDAEDITGIAYESWHFRYVGEEAARYIMESGLTLEEFTEEYRQAIAMFEAGQEWGAPAPQPDIPGQLEVFEQETDAFSF